MAVQIHSALTILRRKQVEARTGLSRSTIYARVKEGSFPTPISLGARAVGWIEAEIDAWLSRQIEGSRKTDPRPRSLSDSRPQPAVPADAQTERRARRSASDTGDAA